MTRKSEKRPKVQDVHDESLSSAGRRRFVKSLLGVGFGVTAANYLTAEDVLAAGKKEVPIVYGLVHGDDGSVKARTKNVPADWYNDLQHAMNAHDSRNFHQRPGVLGSWVVPGEYGGQNASIDVDILKEDARGNIPEHVDSVPVNVNKLEGFSVGKCNTDDEGDVVRGGVKCTNGNGSYGTLSGRIRDTSTNDYYFATSGHLFDNNTGGSLYQPNDQDPRIGKVTDAYCYSDLVVAEPKNGHTPDHHIKRIDSGEPSNVVGIYTKTGLSELKASGELLEKVGVRTCHTQGQIQAVDGETCAYGCRCKSEQLKWGSESDFNDGDSGSLNFHPDLKNPTEDILIGGMNNAVTWWDGENYVWGTAAHHINNEHNLIFG
jgi:hypothetical protein